MLASEELRAFASHCRSLCDTTHSPELPAKLQDHADERNQRPDEFAAEAAEATFSISGG